MEVEIDTSGLHAGCYVLKLAQTNGSTYDLPIQIHPPNPKLSNLPLRVNLGEPQQTFTLEGSGLERIEGLSQRGRDVGAGSSSGRARGICKSGRPPSNYWRR